MSTKRRTKKSGLLTIVSGHSNFCACEVFSLIFTSEHLSLVLWKNKRGVWNGKLFSHLTLFRKSDTKNSSQKNLNSKLNENSAYFPKYLE